MITYSVLRESGITFSVSIIVANIIHGKYAITLFISHIYSDALLHTLMRRPTSNIVHHRLHNWYTRLALCVDVTKTNCTG